MKFRNRIIMVYATVTLLVSIVLGIIMGQTSLRYEKTNQKNNLLISAKTFVSQMDNELKRMDAILYYILSDPNMLNSITWLSKENVPDSYTVNAKSELRIGLSSDYIMKNSYRTVFFNQSSDFESSIVYNPEGRVESIQRLITDFRFEEFPYLEPVIAARGKSVIVKAHMDYWSGYESVPVYSLMKAIQGEGMGFLEVENRMDSLSLLEKADPDMEFLIVVNGDELFYASDESYGDILLEKDRRILEQIEEGDVWSDKEGFYAKASSDSYDLRVLTYKSQDLLRKGEQGIHTVSVISAVSMFGISLLMIIFFSNILTKPIKRLQKVVEETNIENLHDNRILEETGGPDEFQALLDSYQSMTARLDAALKNEKRAAILQLQAQFDMLQVQVNPHFIYNVLNIISSYAVMDSNEVICEMCGSLANMLRYSTNNKERYTAVEKEMEYLYSYFYLLKARYENRLEVSFDIDEGISRQIIPKMTLQQLVENCVQHGFNNADASLHISVVGKVQKDCWYVRITDNGSGISENELAELENRLTEIRKDVLERSLPELEIGGMGLVNTYARCLMLYYEDCIFELENCSDGTGFSVTVGQKISAK